jgi:potassium-dependent mechanosensitive channel
MELSEVLALVNRVLNTTLFTLSGTPVTLVNLLVFGFILLLTIWIARLMNRAATRALHLRGVRDTGVVANIGRLVYYFAIAVGFALAAQNLGFDLDALFAAGAVFAVALGFAMQGLVQNFVSGVILLAERTIKEGDVLEVEGQVVRVTRMGLRVTVARSRDEEDLIIPNTVLAQSTIRNYTLKDHDYRLKANVSVGYDQNVKKVMNVLRETAVSFPGRSSVRDPQVLIAGFGAGTVEFEVQVWTDDPWTARRTLSELNQAIWWSLADAKLVMTSPAFDIHFDPEVNQSLQTMGRSR